MKAALVQMCSGISVARNVQRAAHWVEQAAALGAELIALPEYFCSIRARNDQAKGQENAEAPGRGPVQDALRGLAQRYGVWIIGGSLPLQDEHSGKAFNSCLVYAPDGGLAARYDKMHLFRYEDERGGQSYDETQSQNAGTTPIAFSMKDRAGQLWRIGLGICYDLRFPELFRALSASQPCDIFCLPSAFTVPTGQAHWEILLKARAIENLAFLLAPAQGGKHESGRETFGHSLILDPWGEALAGCRGSDEGVALAELDWQHLQKLRARLPALRHRVLH